MGGAKGPAKQLPDEVRYNANLRAPIQTAVNNKPKARVHSKEWQKIMNGDPVEINPSVGHGYKIMTVDEWSARWKRNDDFQDCLQCGGTNTKEHHFTQVSGLLDVTYDAEHVALTLGKLL